MIYWFAFLMDITINLLVLGIIFRAEDLNASPTELGILGGSFNLPYCLLCFLLAKRLSRLDARPTLALSSALLLVLCLPSALVASVPLLMLTALLIGAVAAFFWPPLEHYVGQGKSADQLYRVLSRFNLWWCSGYVVGTATCGVLYEWDLRLPFLVAGACVVPIVAASFFLPRIAPIPDEAAASAEAAVDSGALRKKKFFLTNARIFIFLTYASAGCIFALFPKLGASLGVSKGSVSGIISALYVGQLLSFTILMKTSRWRNNVSFLLGAQILVAAAFLIVFLSRSTALFSAAFALLGLTWGLAYFSSLYYTLHQPVFRSSLAGVHEALLASGRLLGPILFGAIADLSNLRVPYLCFAIIFLLFGGVTFLRSRRFH